MQLCLWRKIGREWKQIALDSVLSLLDDLLDHLLDHRFGRNRSPTRLVQPNCSRNNDKGHNGRVKERRNKRFRASYATVNISLAAAHISWHLLASGTIACCRQRLRL